MRALKLFTDRPPEYGQVSNRRWLQSVIHITSHRSTELDLRTGCEAFCQRNVHKPRLIPLSVAAVVQIHALWCALSLPPRLRRCCHQSRPTAQLAADRAVEKPCPTRSNLRANTQSPNRANVLRFLASHALGTCDFSPDVARFMQNRHSTQGAFQSLLRQSPNPSSLGELRLSECSLRRLTGRKATP